MGEMYYQDTKYDKVNKEYLKNVQMIKDDDGRQREVGEIDFLKIPRKDLIKVFRNTNEFRLKHGYDNKNIDYTHEDYYELTDEMWDFQTLLNKNLNLSVQGLFGLFVDYLTFNTDEKKFDAFRKVLNETCKYTYRDYDDYCYDYHNEHPHPKQSDVDHDHVGAYELIVMKPIPLKTIQKLLDNVQDHEDTATTKNTEEYDKKYSNKKLDELTKEL